MNKTYRVVYNETTRTYTAVAEIATARGKSAGVVDGTVSAQTTVRKPKGRMIAGWTLGAALFNFSLMFGFTMLPATEAVAAACMVNWGTATTTGQATSTDNNSLACGIQATTGSIGQAVAVGTQANATVAGGVAVGFQTRSGSESVAIGKQTNASTDFSVAVGSEAKANTSGTTQGVAVGYRANASGDQSTAVGANALSSGASSVAIGGDDLDSVSKYNLTGSSTTAINGGTLNAEFKRISGKDLVDTTAQYQATTASGQGSVAVGVQAVSSGHLSTSFGTAAEASGNMATALGVSSIASGRGSLAAAPGAHATAETSIAIGAIAQATSQNATAIAENSRATGNNSIAIGERAQATAQNATALGSVAFATASGANAIGRDAKASGVDSTALGRLANASADGASAIGLSSNAQAQNSVAMGVRATATADGVKGVAIGEDATSSAEKAVAIGAASKGAGTMSIAIGDAANATNTHSFAIGGQSLSTGTNAMAIGSNAQATGNFSVAQGNAAVASADQAQAMGVESVASAARAVAVGSKAQATAANSFAGAADALASGAQAVAIGNSSKATQTNTVALGNGANASAANAIATGVNAAASGSSAIASGNNAIASGNESVAIGRNALSSGANAVATGYGAQATANQAVATGQNAVAAGISSIALGQNAKSGATGVNNTIAIGTSSNVSAVSGTAIGQNTNVASMHAVALGTGATVAAGFDRSVALGAYSTVSAAVPTNSATVGDLTYSGFAGNSPAVGDVVSVGEENGRKRQIQNVAAGRISATSTDAINGSQLFATNTVLGNLATSVKNEFGGDAALNPNGTISFSNIGNTGKDTIHDAIAAVKENVVAGTNIASVTPQVNAQTGATTYTVNANGTTASSADTNYVTVTPGAKDAQNVTNYAVDLSQSAKQKLDNAISGFTTAVNGSTVDTINKDNTVVNFVDGTGTTAAVKNNDITFNVNKSGLTTDNTGNVTANTTGDNFATATDVANAINQAVTRSEKTTTVVKGSNTQVKSTVNGNNTEYTVSADKATVSVSGALTKTESTTTDANGAVTTNYALDLSQTTKDDIKKGVDAKNTVDTEGLTFTGNQGQTDVQKLGSTVAVKGDSNITTEAAGNEITVKLNDNISVNSVSTNNLTVNPNGTVNMNGNTISNVGSGGDTDTNAANIGDVKNAVAAAKEKVIAGTNIASVVEGKEGERTTFTVNAKGTTASVADGDTYLSVTPSEKGDNVTDYQIGLSQSTKDSLAKADTAVQNFKVAVNDNDNVKTVANGGTVKFVDGNATTARAAGEDVTFDVKVDNNSIVIENGVLKATAQAPQVTDLKVENNQVTAPDAADENKLVTAKTVADAINSAGFTLKTSANGGELLPGSGDETINAGKTVDMAAGKNLTVQQAADGKITYATKDEVEFDKVSTNNLTVNNGGNVDMGGNTISNVGSGGTTGTNAANIDDVKNAATKVTSNDGSIKVTPTTSGLQTTYDISVPTTTLTTDKGTVNTPAAPNAYVTADNLANTINTAVASAKEKVEAGTNIVSVESKVDDTTGATTYTVNAKGTTASVAQGDKYLTVSESDKGNNVTDYQFGLTQDAKDSLAKADTAVQNFKVAVNGADIQTVSDGQTVKFVSGTGTTARADGENITFDVNKGGLTTDPAGNVTSTKAGDNFVTGDDVANAINEAAKLTEKTTTVVAGSNTHVQEKAVGNNTEYTVSADKTTVSTGAALKLTKVDSAPDANEAVTTDYNIDLSDETKAQIAKEESVVQGDNVTVTEDGTNSTGGKQFKVALNKNVDLSDTGSVTTGNTTVNNDGVKVGDTTLTNAPITVNGNTVNNVNDAINQTAAQAFNPLTFAGDSGTEFNRKLGEKVNVKGGADEAKLSDGNIGVVANGTDTLEVKLSKELKDLTSAEFKDPAGNTTVVNGAGTTITPANGSPVSLTTTGLNNGGNQITNVASGGDVDTNAANISDVKKAKTEVVKGTNIVDVAKTTGDNGQDVYTVNAKGTTASSANEEYVTVKAGTPNADNVTDYAVDLSDKAKASLDKADTAVQTFTTSVNGDTVETIGQDNNDVGFVNGNVTTARKTDGNDITFDVNFDEKTLKQDGDKLAVNTTTLTPSETDGTVTADNPDNLVTAGDIANAINKAGFKLTASASEGGEVSNATEELVNAGETVTIDAGKNIKLTQAAGKITVATKDDVEFNNVTVNGDVKAGDTVLNKDGVKNGDTSLTKDGITINDGTAGEPVTLTKDGLNNGGNKVTNVADGEISSTSKDAVNGSQLNDIIEKGFKIAADQGDDDTVKLGETVAYRSESGNIITKVSDNNIDFDLANKITVGNNTANPVTIDGNEGTVTGLSNKTWDPANIVSGQAATEDQLKQVSEVANAGWNLTANGENSSNVAATETVDLNNTDGNIDISKTADKDDVTFNLAKDIKVDSVTAGDTTVNNDGVKNGDTSLTKDGITINNGNTDNKPVSLTKDGLDNGGNKITNVADGTENSDAVNLGQLKASKEVVKSEDKSVTVTTTQNDDGANVFDLSVNTDETTITKDADGKVKAKTTTLTPSETDGTVTADNPDNLVTAGDIANAINKAGFKLTASASEGEVSGETEELVNAGETVTIDAGKNIKLTQAAGKITVATQDDVEFNNVTVNGDVKAGNTTVNNDGVKVGDTTLTNAPITVNGNTVNNVNDAINQTAAQAFSPLTFAGDSGTDFARKLGEKVNVKGGATGNLTDNNIAVVADGTDTLNIKLAEKVDLGENGEVKAGNTTVNNDGVKVGDNVALTSDGLKAGDVSVTTSGLNNGGNQIKNVAAGTEDTDGVNVSQLKDAQAAATTKVEGTEGVEVTSSENADKSTTYTVKAKTDGTTTKLDDAGNIVANTTKLENSDKGTVNTPENPDALATAGDIANAINNAGFNVKSGGNKADGDEAEAELVKAGEEVELNAGKNLKVKRTGKVFTFETADDVAFNNVTVAGNLTAGDTVLNEDGITINNGTAGNPVKLGKDGLDNGGNKITNVAAGEDDTDAVNVSQLKAAQAAATTKVIEGDNIVVTPETNTVDGSTTYKVETAKDVAFDNVTVNGDVTAGDTVLNKDGVKVGDTTLTKAPITVNGNTVNNVNDAINQTAAQAFSPLTFAGDSGNNVERKLGTTLNVKGGATGNLTDNNIAVVADGTDTLNIKLAEKVDLGKDGEVKAGDTTVNNDGVKVGDKVSLTKDGLDNGGNQIKNVAAGTEDTDGVNVSQLKAAQAAATTKVVEGDNIVVTPETNPVDGSTTYKVATAKDVKFDSVTTGDTVMNTDGVKVGDKVSLDSDGLKAGDVSVTDKGLDNGGNQIKNVAAGTEDTDGVNVSQLKAAQDAATTKVAGDQGVTVTPSDNPDGSKTYTVAAKTDGTTIKVENGNITANTTKLDNDAKGAVNTPAAPNALATAGDIANAINNAGFTAKANGDAGELINAGDEVNFNNGDNIKVTRSGSDFTIATAKDVKFDSVQLGDNGPKITNNGGNVNVAGNNGAPTKITGVKAGEADTDAVNVKQLKAAKTEVEAGKNMVVTERKGANDQPIYTVATADDLNVNSVTAGNTTVNGNGVTIAAPTEGNPQNTVSLSPIGLNNGGNTITNVAPGVNDTDAVNVGQLKAVGNQLGNRINQVDADGKAGVAQAMATAGLPQAYLPGKSMMALGGGVYRGETGYAVGFSSISDGGNWIIKGTASGNSRGHYGATAAVGYQW